ncbi:MAG: ATP-binding protein [Opitutaceae bacterium]|nr:ATP-binding protein [Opitutaceae bacterium]
MFHALLLAAVFVLASATKAAEARPASPARAPAGSSAAELGLPLQRYFSSDDYDGFSRVTAVAHTAEGFTLFGTYQAAILYDGAIHEKIPVPATYVTALCRDHDGLMWVGGDNEIGVIEADAVDGQLHYVSRTGLLPATARSFGRIRAMVASRAGVFVATSNGLLHFAPGFPLPKVPSGIPNSVPPPRDVTTGRAEFLPLPPESRLQLFAIGGRVYLQDSRRGLLVFEGGGFRPVNVGRDLAGREIQLVERDEAHALCVVEGEGLFHFDLATGRLEKIATPLDALLAEPMVRVLRLQDGRVVFIRGNSRGVVIADSTLQGAQVLDAKTGLANTVILGAALDAEDGLWLGTANGLLRLDLAPGLTVFDERNAFPIGSSGSLVRHGGVLYAGSTQGLMRLVPGEPSTGTPARFVPDPRVPEICDNLRDTPEGLLFSTNDTVELLTAAGRRQLFDPQAKITMIKPNRRTPGVYFIATDDGGFHVMNLAAGTTRRVLSLPPGVTLWNGAEESDRASWFGTAASGFWRITAPDSDWTEATAESHPLGQASLTAGKSWTGVFALFDDLHFLTETGMYRWHPATRTFTPDDRFRIEGVNPLRFMPVVADTTGRAWTSPWLGTLVCARPLGYFQAAAPVVASRGSQTKLEINAGTSGSGKPDSFVWHDAPARWQAGVGRFGAGLVMVESEAGRPVLWTKSPTAIARIELDTLPAARAGAAWRPVLRRFMTGERSWPMAGGSVLRLPFSNQPITLRYAAPRYQPGAPVRYQTRLRGFREEWSAPTTSNETVFTNLTGGPFGFEVRAIDADGVVSETARLTFSVALPWHRSTGAFVLYAIMGAGLVVLFVRWRLRYAELERSRLERLVADRTLELAAAKQQAESASQAKSVFLASMSHELRTPLNGVIGYAQIMMKDRELTAKNRERLRIVQSSGEHLLRMINEVLDLSKIEAGRMELHPAPFHLPQFLRDIAAAISTRAEQKQLEFVFEPDPDLPEMVVGDVQKLRQVIDNLLSNAIKFTSQGEVCLRARLLVPDRVEFSVADTGPGIREADRARIFQPFRQIAAPQTNEPGTGLGLTISQRLVALMDSRLVVESKPGTGSCFTFEVRLPALAVDATDATRPARVVSGYVGPRRKVLVVDDVAVNRHVLRDLLQPLGFEIIEAASGESALASTTAELALVDLRMPDMDGLELARRLRARPGGDRLKLVAMSASVLSFNRDDVFAAGCDGFLPKPFREADLLEIIGRLLGMEWTYSEEAPPARRNSGAPFTEIRSQLDAATLGALLACAQRGEILALRDQIATLRASGSDPLLDSLELMARSYRMEQIRQLLERQITALAAKK